MKKILKLIFILILLSLILIIAFKIPKDSLKKTDTIQEEIYSIPYVNFRNRDKTIIHEYLGDDISSLPGEKIFISFWSAYCKYCLQEYEAIVKAQENFKDMTFVIISHDQNIEDLKNFLDKNPSNLFIIHNPTKSIRTKLNKSDKYIPSLYVLDKEKNIVKHTNEVLNAEEIVNFILE